MKTILGYSIILMMFMVSCNDSEEYIMLTRINTDGTIYREFIKSTDSAFMVGDTSRNPFPVLIDSGWKITYAFGLDSLPEVYKEGWPLKVCTLKADSNHYLKVKASRMFLNDSDLSKYFRFNNIKWNYSITQDFSMNKSFKWFYTKYNYCETFKKMNPNANVKISDYMTDEEISQLFGENNSYTQGRNGNESMEYLKKLEEKAQQWQSRCIYEAYYNFVSENLSSIEKPNCTPDRFKIYKDTIFNLMRSNIMENDTGFFNTLDLYFNTKGYKDYYSRSDSIRKLFKEAGERVLAYFPGYLTYLLIAPGNVTGSNASSSFGDTLQWKVNSDRFLFSDYKIQVTSKVMHIWAFIITGLLLIFSTIMVWYFKRK